MPSFKPYLSAFVAKEERSELSKFYRVERFWSYVETSIDENACWHWRGPRDRRNYGVFSAKSGEFFRAHRVAWVLCYGEEIPDGLDLDHLCHTLDVSCFGGAACEHRGCVRPSHLEPVSRGENIQRGIRSIIEAVRRREERRTECRHGHSWIPENIMLLKNGHRRCLLCHRDDEHRSRAKRTASLQELHQADPFQAEEDLEQPSLFDSEEL